MMVRPQTNSKVGYFKVLTSYPKGPSTHGEEFADEYSTNIRRRIFFSSKIFLKNIKFAKANKQV